MKTKFTDIAHYFRFVNNFNGELVLRGLSAFCDGNEIAHLEKEYLPKNLKKKL